MLLTPNAPIKQSVSGAIDLLVVEDNPGDARLIDVMLREVGGVHCRFADSMAEAAISLASEVPDAVLLDLSLPDSRGLDTVHRIQALAPALPIVIFTGLADESMGLMALQLGCQDYLVKGAGDGNLIRRTILYAIERKDMEVERRVAAQRLDRVMRQTVRSLSLALEMRDPYTTGHQQRVAQLAEAIGRRLGLSEEELGGLYTGGLVHDIGKINVPAEYLSRPGSLPTEVHAVIRMHPVNGWEILRDIEFTRPIGDMILQHHERLDGSGYPYGLKGDQIILEARILAVADVLEAISSFRPYRPALGVEVALDEVRNNAGTRYDSVVVDACIAQINQNGGTIFGEAELFRP